MLHDTSAQGGHHVSSPEKKANCLKVAGGLVNSLLQAAPGKIDEDAGQAEVPGGGMLFVRGTGTAVPAAGTCRSSVRMPARPWAAPR